MKTLRKVVAIIFSISLLLLLSSCSSSKLDGRWVASAKVNFNVGNFSAEKYTFLENTTCNYNLSFDEEGTYDLSRSVPKTQRDKAVEEYQKLYIDYFKSKHSESEIAALVANSESCDTADEYIKMALLGAAQKNQYSNISDYICDSLNISTKVLASGKYEFDGDVLYLYTVADEENPISVGTVNNNTITMTFDSVVLEFSPEQK